MTAVASPPSVQSGPRLGWYESGNGGQGALSSMNGDEVSRMFMPRKTIQRSNSSSSLGSTTSTSTVTSTPQNTNAGQSHIPESATCVWREQRTLSSNARIFFRSHCLVGYVRHPSPALFHCSIPTYAPTPTKCARAGSAPSGEPPAVLTLVPLNGTFEKKQINVPYFPEVVRIGRQTNAKTVPTPANGFFDSKVLSRQHAEVWAEKGGRIFIRDVKSSNGTFVNGTRLSPENRESEPHELRENDQLELGIDIISEDQTTVVHHKVCCKVEYAGVYGTMPNILDLTLGDLDPASGGGLLPSPLSQPLSHMRGRSGSSLSNRSVQSTASSQFNALQQQRQMNYWNSPISIEQVVKRLTSEMKQAKQQSQDLRQTDEFLTNLTKSGHPEKERVKSSPADSTSSRQVNGRPKMPRLDSFSRFSDPPAPPPQQPLPEKPDAFPRNGTDATSPLKRSDTEKPKIGATSSPVSRESSQILSLIEALSSAKRELDSQGARVKELESLLLEERTARQSAEEKARSLELRAKDNDIIANHTISDSHTINNQETSAEKLSSEETLVNGVSSEPSLDDSIPEEKSAATNNNDLQQRLEAMMEEMEEMRKQITVFRETAEKAESETAETRKSLAEMIETLRREREERSEANESTTQTQDATDHSSPSSADEAKNHPAADSETEPECTGTSPLSKVAEISDTTFATQPRKHDILQHSSPYASMLGVVLLGVGLMAYLNGWQKMDK
ncbi:cytoplasm to vacuole targeting Vps64 [Aspergillus arachidicola]|uniref:Cytoplasm to vacuole targeting Vps64 n=1 Tax=Aspergillus arachidicola TaxID=656916 RepID=A0A2G7G7L2_9EURO|nr:cytoplasm to vacuole targeting Vps64 [Aspergillus arachidicola]